jgi:hypothetical protein
VLEDKGLRNYGTDAARTEQAGQGSKEMDKEKDQIAHRRIVAGREILRKYGQNNNSPATRPREPGKTMASVLPIQTKATERS